MSNNIYKQIHCVFVFITPSSHNTQQLWDHPPLFLKLNNSIIFLHAQHNNNNYYLLLYL